MLRTGCAWRHLPHDFAVSWSAAHQHFLRWCPSGTWARILTTVRSEVRNRSRRRRRPSAAVVDSSSVKASPVAGPRGFDGAKKVDGVKRHILVDSSGVLVLAVVTPADVQDRAAFPKPPRKAKQIAPTITHVWVDKGYTGQAVSTAAAKVGVTVDVVSAPKTRPRVHRPTATLGPRTHQRLDQSLPTHRPPLPNHPGRPRRPRLPQPNRLTTTQTRPQPVVRHALGTTVANYARFNGFFIR